MYAKQRRSEQRYTSREVDEVYVEDIDIDMMDAINMLFTAYGEDSNNQNEKRDRGEDNASHSDPRGKIQNHCVGEAEFDDRKDEDYEVRSEDSIEWIDNDVEDVLDSEEEDDIENVVDSGELSLSDDEEVLLEYDFDDSDNVDINLEDEENAMGRTVKDLRGRLYKIPTEDDIKITAGQTFNSVYEFREVLKDYVIQVVFV